MFNEELQSGKRNISVHILKGTTMEYVGKNNTEPSVTWVERALVPSLFLGACFLIGVPGNGFVIWTILCKITQRSLTVVLLLNLAVADFIVLITLPLWIHSLVDKWVYGLFACQFLTYVIYCTMYASVFFLTVMSIQRLTAVLYPLASRRWQKKKPIYGMVLTVWVLALVSASPVFVFRSILDSNGTVHCIDTAYTSETLHKTDLWIEMLVGFVIPFSIMIMCYALVILRIQRLKFQGKSKSGTLIASVVIAFFVCWFPYHVVNALTISVMSKRSSNPDTSRRLENITKAVENISGALAFFSSCLNPILYAFAARSFRGWLKGPNFDKLFRKLNEDTVEKEDTAGAALPDI